MIKFNSALDSVLRRGITNDGPVNSKPAIAAAKAIPGITTADKIVSSVAETSRNVAESLTRDQRYKHANAEKIKERDRLRKTAKKLA